MNEALAPKKETIITPHDPELDNHIVEPSITKLSDPANPLPISTVSTRYSIANDMTGGRIDAMPSAIQ